MLHKKDVKKKMKTIKHSTEGIKEETFFNKLYEEGQFMTTFKKLTSTQEITSTIRCGHVIRL